ncbi:MAG TPA: hypothetical protein VMF86_18890 [Stellaceae bacterium]|nr:hypothetical protein [Stellaceae bacterium]
MFGAIGGISAGKAGGVDKGRQTSIDAGPPAIAWRLGKHEPAAVVTGEGDADQT